MAPKKSDTTFTHASSSSCLAGATQILPCLFLGPRSSSSSISFLASNRITHILSIGSTPLPILPVRGFEVPQAIQNIVYKRLSLNDDVDADMRKVAMEAVAWVERVLGSVMEVKELQEVVKCNQDREGKIKERARNPAQPPGRASFSPSSSGHSPTLLIHCSAGISRSPTIVIVYLMLSHCMSLRAALALVIGKRSNEIFGERDGWEGSMDNWEELPRGKKERMEILVDAVSEG
ncbi:protein-tyrosine phosphatase-like protein [Crassisporium funariophilum]|nr:protein-tyrosine phosphatase-like protein [Crassisporium funariophilum]